MKNGIYLKWLKLENFKCFENTMVHFKDLSIIVGENNAGKSCLIEALRLVSVAAQQAKSRVYKMAPKSLNLPLHLQGFEINTEKLKIQLDMAVYFYKDVIAKITAQFSDNNVIEVYVSTESAFAVLTDSKGSNIKLRTAASKLNFNRIGILPQIGLIRDQEKLLQEKTINEDKDTYLSSLHFRNEIYLYRKDFFEDFKFLAESTWPGLEITPVEYNYSEDKYLQFYLVDSKFTAEIANMGSGIKMWLQIMWFLARTKEYEIIILDEPDVYMHADLQRKLLDIVIRRYPQVIIATHSLEIISRVEPENILSVNKKSKRLRYANDSNAVQSIIDNIGGIQNLSLIRLGLARKCLFIEGRDLPFLNRFNEILYKKRLDIPTLEYGGFSNLSNVYGASNLLHIETEGNIICYALSDKDYRTKEINDAQINKAKEQNLYLHIWEKKEIENYLINTKVLFRIIEKKCRESYEEFCNQIDELVEEMKQSVILAFAEKYKEENPRLVYATCYKKVEDIIKKDWTTLDNKISFVSGKDLLAKIRKYVMEKYKISLTDNLIQKNFQVEDIPIEMRNVLEKLQ